MTDADRIIDIVGCFFFYMCLLVVEFVYLLDLQFTNTLPYTTLFVWSVHILALLLPTVHHDSKAQLKVRKTYPSTGQQLLSDRENSLLNQIKIT